MAFHDNQTKHTRNTSMPQTVNFMPNTEQIQDPKMNKMQLVQYSVRAQQHIIQQEHKRLNSLNNFPEELSALGSPMAAHDAVVNASMDSTVASQANDASLLKASFTANGKPKLDPLLAPLQLPRISEGNKSPFKGFLDISIVAQKMRKGMIVQQQSQNRGGLRANHSMKGSIDFNAMSKEERSKIKKDNFFAEGAGDYGSGGDGHGERVKQRGKSEHGKRGARMNPMVLETWINETLQDAEHLDIPGCILKPDNAQPVSRYGINRSDLYDAGMDHETVDRIYRALFVYSVGFYELIKKCLAQTSKKYTIITKIWKVFSILLEYCCRTDYRMLISEISQEHDAAMEELKQKYEARFQEQANNEKTLKQNLEMLQKYNDTLEKERQSERQMRLKLEEEYMQNTKNHEEEVQLRLKFESKLNNMHSAHRDLDTKYKRTQQDLVKALQEKEELQEQLQKLLDQNTQLKTENTKQESALVSLNEKVTGQRRDLELNQKQKQELDQRNSALMSDLDDIKFKQQEQEKNMTASKLNSEMLQSENVALKTEKDKLLVELKSTRELQSVFESRCSEQLEQLNKLKQEHQEVRKQNIGADELAREREDRIAKLRAENSDLKEKLERLDIEYNTLSISHEKVTEQYEACSKELEDRSEMLHSTNKVRHETEIKLAEEIEKTRSLQDLVKNKDDGIQKKNQEIEELDKKVLELERNVEALQIKYEGERKSSDLLKKQSAEKVASLNEMLTAEKEARDNWIERYEKEQQAHTATQGELLQARSELKDQQLAYKNAEIKFNAINRQLEVVTAQNKKFQDQLNEATAKEESAARELSTQKEIMKQFEASKKEYIEKLKKELSTVEERFTKREHQKQIMGEDYRSQAVINYRQLVKAEIDLNDLKNEMEKTEKDLLKKSEQCDQLLREQQMTQMETEDHVCQIFYNAEELARLRADNEETKKEIEELTERQKAHNEEVESNLKRIHELHAETQNHKNQMLAKDKEIQTLEDKLEQLQIDNEDLVQDLKSQLAEAQKSKQKAPSDKGSESKASHRSIKQAPPKEVEVIKEVVKEVIKEVPRQEVETRDEQAQTDIAMDYFDRERSLPKTDSRGRSGSGALNSKPRNTEGSSKPPRQPSQQLQSSEGAKKSRQSVGSKDGQPNGDPQLPNLLTNSRGTLQAQRKSHLEQMPAQSTEDSKKGLNKSKDTIGEVPEQIQAKDIQTLNSSKAPAQEDVTQDGTINSNPQNYDNTIQTIDPNNTITASAGGGPQTMPSDPMNINDESQPNQHHPETIPEEDDQVRRSGSNFGKTTQTRFVDTSQHALSNNQNDPSDPGRQSKKSSNRSSQNSKKNGFGNQGNPRVQPPQQANPNAAGQQPQLISKQSLSKQSLTQVKQISGTSLNNPGAQMTRYDESPQRADTHPKNESDQGSANNSRNSRRSGVVGGMEAAQQQQKFQNRMKVNINNQEMLSNEEQSYLGGPNQNDAQTSLMQPQMAGTPSGNQLVNQGGGQPMPPNQQQQLQQSRNQNNRRVTGPSTIRTLIKSAATR